VKEWDCPNNPDYLKKTTKWGCLFFKFSCFKNTKLI
jgi:hypothetical protein